MLCLVLHTHMHTQTHTYTYINIHNMLSILLEQNQFQEKRLHTQSFHEFKKMVVFK